MRFDYIWASPALAARLLDVRVLAEKPFLGAVPDPKEFALSDHLSLMATFA